MSNLSKNPTITLIILLVLTGTVLMCLRLVFSSQDSIPTGDSVWLLNTRADFTTTATKTTLLFSPPHDTQYARVISQNILHPGLKIRKASPGKSQNRLISIVAQDSGDYYLDVEYLIHFSPVPRWSSTQTASLDTEDRERYLSEEPDIQFNSDLIKTTFATLNKGNVDKKTLLNRIFSYVYQNISPSRRQRNNDALTAIRNLHGTALGQSRAMIALCRLGNLPARLVTGFVFRAPVDDKPHYWVEIYLDDKWLRYDPFHGHESSLPSSYIPVNKENPHIFSILEENAVKDLNIQYELSQQEVPKRILGGSKRHYTNILDLTLLPIGLQTTLATLFLLPLGVLFTAFFKNALGIHSYGTFTPTLLALAATYTDWFTGIMIFSLVALFGITGRYFLSGSKINRAVRLGVVFTLTAVSMAIGVSILEYFQFSPNGQVVLLPIVILTTLVDRIYSTADQSSVRNAIVRLAWTTIIGIGCFLIMAQEPLGYFFLEFPEAHFITIGMILLVSQYKGKKLTDFGQFRLLTETRVNK